MYLTQSETLITYSTSFLSKSFLCIVLKLNLQESRNILKRLIQADFYLKNERDFEIMCGIRQGKGLDDINEILLIKGLAPLS